MANVGAGEDEDGVTSLGSPSPRRRGRGRPPPPPPPREGGGDGMIGPSSREEDTSVHHRAVREVRALKDEMGEVMRPSCCGLCSSKTIESLECGHSDGVRGVAWSPDGQVLATASADFTLRVWGVGSGEGGGGGRTAQPPLEGHADRVLCCGWSADGGTLASGGADGVVCLWEQQGSGGWVRRATQVAHEGGVSCLAWSRGGALATGGEDGAVRVWAWERGGVGAELRLVETVGEPPDGGAALAAWPRV